MKRFRRLLSQWGGVLAPRSKGGARSLPAREVELAVAAEVTDLSASSDYWQLGSAGVSSASPRNNNPASQFVGYALHLRRGLGLGLQVSGSVGYLSEAGALMWGVDVRQGLLEAMGAEGTLLGLDFSIGAGARAVTGIGELRVSSQAMDVRVARTFNVSANRRLTPWLGPQLLRIQGASEWVDFTPWKGSMTPCAVDTTRSASGLPVTSDCESPEGELANMARFRTTTIVRKRLQAGVSLRQDFLVIGLQLAADWFPSQFESQSSQADELDCATCARTARQWAADLQLGVLF